MGQKNKSIWATVKGKEQMWEKPNNIGRKCIFQSITAEKLINENFNSLYRDHKARKKQTSRSHEPTKNLDIKENTKTETRKSK